MKPEVGATYRVKPRLWVTVVKHPTMEELLPGELFTVVHGPISILGSRREWHSVISTNFSGFISSDVIWRAEKL